MICSGLAGDNGIKTNTVFSLIFVVEKTEKDKDLFSFGKNFLSTWVVQKSSSSSSFCVTYVVVDEAIGVIFVV